MKPLLYYISDVGPSLARGGGSIVIHRHLKHLAEAGWQVHIITPEHGPDSSPISGCSRFLMPARKWYWPPFRLHPDLILKCRLTLNAWHAFNHGPNLRRPAVVLSICTGPFSLIACRIAELSKCPLVTIVHDWWGERDAPLATICGDRVVAQSDRVLCVSEEMADLFRRQGARQCEVLYPLSGRLGQEPAKWKDSHAANPVIAHVGALHPYHFPLLLQLARLLEDKSGKLLLLCPETNEVLRQLREQVPNLCHQDYFSTDSEARRFILEHASALSIMYPFAQNAQGIPPTGFQSRFVEFSQLGLPILLSAPSGNPLRTWARNHHWSAACDPQHQESLRGFVEQLTQRSEWERLAGESLAAAKTVFSPDRIEQQLESALLKAIEESAKP